MEIVVGTAHTPGEQYDEQAGAELCQAKHSLS